MATTIATLTQKTDGSLEGVFATIRVNAPIAIVPNAQKASEEAPDFRVIHRRTGFEIGAGWNRIARQTGEEYLSVKLEAREIGERLQIQAQADVSTGGTERTWSAGPTLGWKFGRSTSALLGYRHMVVDFDTSDADAEVDATMTLSGVVAGLQFTF